MQRTVRGTRVWAVVSAIAALAAGVGTQPAWAEEPERTVEITLDNVQGWDGTMATGVNQDYNSAAGEPCGDGLDDQCDTTLVHVNVPADHWHNDNGGLQIDFVDFFPNSTSDFDVYVYKSDADGTRGGFVDSSEAFPAVEERVEIPAASGYYLVQVVYFAVTESRYTAVPAFVSRHIAPNPPDVDHPAGLQDVLASNPALGFLSHSEPHIAQSPTNPNILVAASKMYNRDPDSLAEYEFKVGTYVSFDRGKSWTDLGQTAICGDINDAPAASWPANECYPADDPTKDGTGSEDSLETPVEGTIDKTTDELGGGDDLLDSSTQTAGGGDVGEEYIVSDPWVQFDDEGNAHLMVLDSPPFEHGNGWGMAMHRWMSVSPSDLEPGGSTWGQKIPINVYTEENTQAHFLDDKNTFAVNNAGADGDGKPGIMIACWGQNVTTAIKQQTVCERSTNGGRTWPDTPLPISGMQQLVIGVSVVADKVDPLRFYATWLHYTPGVIGEPDELWTSQTLDGGLTWTPPTLVTRLHGIPRTFPGQEFRNLSIPHMATGPAKGQVYLTYPEYLPAQGDDEDGMQADIRFMQSSDGGLTWSLPKVINKGSGISDEFQQQIAVAPSGQINVSFFGRQYDPDNFYIDTFLTRSSDGGASWTESRVSHDVWDPSINPPISGSGQFIGDYQGLVADDCFAIPFVNDTHLANAKNRDPGYDAGVKRSQYQQVFSWRVPNTSRLGGAHASLPKDCGK